MSHRLSPYLLSLLALAAVASLASAQSYPCGTSAGTNCRALIPDYNAPIAHVDSVITVVPSGACASQPVSRAGVQVNVLHDWRTEVGIQLLDPATTAATLQSGVVASGITYPTEDIHQLWLAPALVGSTAAGAWTLRLNDVDNSGYGALDDWTLYLVCGPIPVVTITASDPLSAEDPLDTGTFTITRSVVTAAALDVSLLISGTAGAGDYAPLAVVVTIPANQASVTLVVTPVLDALNEAAETVIATLDTAALYSNGAPSEATVVLYDTLAQVPALDRHGLAALMALLALAGVFLLRSRQA